VRQAVAHTAEFERIAALPRRHVEAAKAAVWATVLTEAYARPGRGARLRPWQALALAEAAEHGGAFLALPVGLGKTLIAELLPAITNARRTVLIVPGPGLRAKTYADRIAIQRDWRLSANPATIVTLSDLQHRRNAWRLHELDPDLLVIDESDDLANFERSMATRVDRFLRDKRARLGFGAVRVVVMSGTPARKSILDYWHHLRWALGDGAPVPAKRSEAQLWAAALDLETHGVLAVRPGPLGATIAQARRWYRERLQQTPGVLIVNEDSAGDVPIRFETRLAREDRTLDAAFRKLLVDGENPAGIPVTDDSANNPLSLWRLDAQTGCGLVTYWDPPPPVRWRLARRNVARFVRQAILHTRHSPRPLDTESQVFAARSEHPAVREWLAVRGTYDQRKHTRVKWLSRSALDSVRDWLAVTDEPSVVWCGSVDFAQALERETGLPYYRQGGATADGDQLHQADPSQSLIASWHANKKGFNLQAWSRALVVFPPQSAKWIEQFVGRHHRAGQTREVRITVLLTSGGTADAFEAAITEAHCVEEREGLTQKLLRARIDRARPRLNERNRFRWARKRDDDKHARPAPAPQREPTPRTQYELEHCAGCGELHCNCTAGGG